MNVRTRAALLSVAALAGTALAHPANALDLYFGAGIVQADARVAQPTTPIVLAFSFKEQSTSWKAIAGVRPISLIGFELEHIDLRSVDSGPVLFASQNVGAVRGSVSATGAFGLLYLPLPTPLLDVYAKAGYVQINAKARTAPAGGIFCPAISPSPWYCGVARDFDLDDKAGAAGVGLQLKLGSWGLRGEYEVLLPKGPDTHILSVTVVKHFL
jgi:hypothetical protein